MFALKVVSLVVRSIFFQILKVATNETFTLHSAICTWISLEIYNNNDQQFNRHGFRWQSWPTRLDRFAIYAIPCFWIRICRITTFKTTLPYSEIKLTDLSTLPLRLIYVGVHLYRSRSFLIFIFLFFYLFYIYFLAFDFCRFCVVIRFFHPHHNGQWPPTSKDFLSQILSITFIFLSLFLRKSQYFPFWMFSAKQGHYWYHFYNVFGMTRSLTGDWTRDLPHSKPALYH